MTQEEINERRLQLQRALVKGTNIDTGTAGVTAIDRPDSSNIARVAYGHETKVMTVTFRNGGVYQYEPISWETFHAIAAAPSAGKAFDHHIRKAGPEAEFTTTKVDLRVLDHVMRQAPQEPVLPGYQAAPELPDASALEPDVDPAAAGCTHPGVNRYGAPMQRCPQCGKIVTPA